MFDSIIIAESKSSVGEQKGIQVFNSLLCPGEEIFLLLLMQSKSNFSWLCSLFDFQYLKYCLRDYCYRFNRS